MLIELRLLGDMKRHVEPEGLNGGHGRMDMREGARLSEVLAAGGIDERKTLVVLLNGRRPAGDPVLREGDAVSVFPPVAGG